HGPIHTDISVPLLCHPLHVIHTHESRIILSRRLTPSGKSPSRCGLRGQVTQNTNPSTHAVKPQIYIRKPVSHSRIPQTKKSPWNNFQAGLRFTGVIFGSLYLALLVRPTFLLHHYPPHHPIHHTTHSSTLPA
ncbi:unnamed protein product, partial [Laminaria digitata]